MTTDRIKLNELSICSLNCQGLRDVKKKKGCHKLPTLLLHPMFTGYSCFKGNANYGQK